MIGTTPARSPPSTRPSNVGYRGIGDYYQTPRRISPACSPSLPSGQANASPASPAASRDLPEPDRLTTGKAFMLLAANALPADRQRSGSVSGQADAVTAGRVQARRHPARSPPAFANNGQSQLWVTRRAGSRYRARSRQPTACADTAVDAGRRRHQRNLVPPGRSRHRGDLGEIVRGRTTPLLIADPCPPASRSKPCCGRRRADGSLASSGKSPRPSIAGRATTAVADLYDRKTYRSPTLARGLLRQLHHARRRRRGHVPDGHVRADDVAHHHDRQKELMRLPASSDQPAKGAAQWWRRAALCTSRPAGARLLLSAAARPGEPLLRRGDGPARRRAPRLPGRGRQVAHARACREARP